MWHEEVSYATAEAYGIVGRVEGDRLVWSEHGSTRYLWDDADVLEACEYVTNCQ